MPSWHAHVTPGAGRPDGVAVWRRAGSGAVISLVVAGLHPLIVVAGAGGLGDIGEYAPGGLPFLAAWHARGALRRFARAAQEAGGREVATAALPGLVRVAGDRLSWRVTNEYKMEELTRRQRFRSCPRCDSASEAGMRWCPQCEYEFTGADDHDTDLRNARWQRDTETLRKDLARLRADEFPPLPVSAPTGFTPPGRPRR